MNWEIYFDGLIACLLVATITWMISVVKKDVSIVDSAWSLLFISAALFYLTDVNQREWLVLVLLLIWSIRLCAHITLRSWGEEEDPRYQAIREKYSPGFSWKSWGIIFVFQAVLAWLLTLPLFVIFSSPTEMGLLSYVAAAVIVFGICFEAIADWQLYQFKSKPENRGKVMDSGLWHYSRHPNYFGEATVWWGFFLFALDQGAWWSIASPILITFLLLRFSGVSLMESTITERRPAYREYIASTNAFIPGPRKATQTKSNNEELS